MSNRQSDSSSWLPRALSLATPVLFVLVLALFGLREPRFVAPTNLLNILLQATPTALVAVGMTFVLITAGVDLSVGALMFVGAACAGKLALAGLPLWLCLTAMLGVGLLGGAINATLVTRFRILPFIATLALLSVGRGLGLWITETRAMNLPESFLQFGSARWLGIPFPLWVLAVVIAVSHLTLMRTPFGRQLFAVGHNQEAARKAGLNVNRLLAAAYIICGACAGIGGAVALAQLGAVSPKFGEFYEFDAITAAVLGGASLFGGRGNVFPGPILGAVLVKSIFNGLVMLQADPYLFPLLTSAIIFLAVLFDCLRSRWLERLNRRRIYVEPV